MGFSEFTDATLQAPPKKIEKPNIEPQDDVEEMSDDPAFVHEANLVEEKYDAKKKQEMLAELNLLRSQNKINMQEFTDFKGYLDTHYRHIVENYLDRQFGRSQEIDKKDE